MRGQIGSIVLLIVLILFGIIMAFPLIDFPKETGPNTTQEPCIDYDPPNTARQISFRGDLYNLIKERARVPGPNPPAGEENKFQSGMILIGNTDSDNRPVYQLRTTNYFGEPNDPNVIYVLIEQKDGASFFEMYLKNGEPIPDFIRNCKRTGGQILTTVSYPDQFPPNAFNSSQIIGTPPPNLAPGYVRTGRPKLPTSEVQRLNGLSQIGILHTSKGNLPLYYHLATIFLIDGADAYEYLGTSDPIPPVTTGENAVQVEKIYFITTPYYSWWTPECKPAIYLYPKNKENINVKVIPKGYLTLTIPPYPDNGWSVTAYPDGTIETNDKTYPYLYYESKIADNAIEKPNKGYVIPFSLLPAHFDTLLPQLGLSSKEQKDFKDYWQNVLPYSPYYFIGALNENTINKIESMEVIPKPTTTIRIRLFFRPLQSPIHVEPPTILTPPQRNGFTIVEWGGLVKLDKGVYFTCSM